MRLNLVLRHRSDNLVELSLPLSFRVVFGAIALVMVISAISVGEFSVVLFVITAFVVIASLYEERWLFNRLDQLVEHRFGIIGITTRKRIPMGSIDGFVLSNLKETEPDDRNGYSMSRRIRLKSLVYFQIAMAEGGSKTVEIRPNQNNESLRENAEHIAEFCGKPLDFV